MSAFATLEDVIALTGKNYTDDEQARINTLLPIMSDALRQEAVKVGKDLDGDPMTQESQSAINYSWSGTYAIPGGGFAAAIMKNDLKRLGLRRQRYGVIEFYGQEDQ